MGEAGVRDRLDRHPNLKYLSGPSILRLCVSVACSLESFTSTDCVQYDRRKSIEYARSYQYRVTIDICDFITALRSLDALARKARKTSSDSQLAVEEHSILGYLYHGFVLLGRFAEHGLVFQSLVGSNLVLSFTEIHLPTTDCNSFQQVQHLSALETSIRYLPNIMAGIVLNIVTGLLLHRIRVDYFVIITSAICTISPLLMAIINPTWSWWWCTFWAMLLIPVSVNGNTTLIPPRLCIHFKPCSGPRKLWI